MPIISGGKGGFTSISVGAGRTAVDLHAAATTTALKWDSIFDNVWNGNPLSELPSGLGLTFAFDGSDGTITTTTAGTWIFTTALAGPADTAWVARLFDQFSGFGVQVTQPQDQGQPTLSLALTLPLGATGGFSVSVTHAATANPYNVTANMSIVRIA